MPDNGCLMLVEDSIYSGDNKRDPLKIQHPETSIQNRFVYCLKAILKLVSFVTFFGMYNG